MIAGEDLETTALPRLGHDQLPFTMQLEALQSLALSVAAARSTNSILTELVQGLGMTEGVALARVWLLQKEAGEAPYLELRASVGASVTNPTERWTRTDGGHQKLPLAYGKVGQIARTNQPLLLQRGAHDWLMQPDWAKREGIESFAGQPLCFKDQVLGVVACFSRKRIEKRDLKWLRVFADYAAVAVANARAFEELGRLKENAERERDYLREAVRSALQQGEIIAESSEMQGILAQIHAVAQSDAAVLLLGESGVGKELIAVAIHDASRRREGPLVKVNCASVPRELFESEFFGHVRGAFSGASRDRQGRFLLADGGTLFLDEVGEIPLDLQGKLLRVLQEQSFEPVGDDRTRRVNVRVIAATNRALESDVEAGRFRRDLYYRLSVLPLHVPPLRSRRADILPMARRFLRSTALRLNVPEPALSAADEGALIDYDFPGNVRELQNVIERGLVLSAGSSSGLRLDLPGVAGARRSSPPAAAAAVGPAQELEVLPVGTLIELERKSIENALLRCDGKVAGERGAAKLLAMPPSTLSYRMRQLGIERRR